MSKAVMQQALEALEKGETKLRWAAISALKQALAEPEQEPVESISAEQLSKMFQRLEGIDQNQWGYHWRCGWNDALREAMDYCQAAPTPRKPQTTHWEGCEAVHPECRAIPRRPLTDEEIADLWDGHTVPVFGKTGINPIVFARAIERAHGIGEQT